MADQNDPDYKEYQDYLDYQEYQKYTAGQKQQKFAGSMDNSTNSLPNLPPQKPIYGSVTQRGSYSGTGAPKVPGMPDHAFEENANSTDMMGNLKRNALSVGRTAREALPMAGGIAGSYLGGPVGSIGGATAGASLKALLGGSDKPSDIPKDIAMDTLTQGVIPEGLGLTSRLVGNSLKYAGDRVMQGAVGMKKYIPGLGTALADEGIMGTRGMMKNQLDSSLSKYGTQISEGAKRVENISTDTASQEVLKEMQKLVQADGSVHPEHVAEYTYLKNLADQIAERGGVEGTVTGEVGGSARRLSGDIARKKGAFRDNPAETLKAQALAAEQRGWSKSLKEGFANQHPDEINQIAEADKAYSMLTKARKPLNQPGKISQSIAGMAVKASIPALLGYGTAGVPGAIAGAALGLPLPQSMGGQALTKLGNAAIRTEAAGQITRPALWYLLRKGDQEDQE